MKQIRDNYNNQITQLEKNFEKREKRYKDQLTQRLRPGGIKSIEILLKNLSFDNVNEEDYDKAYKEYKTSRDNFSRKSEDQTRPKVERLMFEELKKLADMRLDMLNITFGRPAETRAGRDFVNRADQTWRGYLYRLKQRIVRNLSGFTAGGGFMGVLYFFYDYFIRPVISGARSVAIQGYRTASYLLSKAKAASIPATNLLNTGATIVSTGTKIAADAVKIGADTAKFVADNTIKVFIAIITVIAILYSSSRK